MANWSSLRIYHPIEDFEKTDQEYFKKYHEAVKASEKYWIPEGDRKRWEAKFSYEAFIADYMNFPSSKDDWSRIKTHAYFSKTEDRDLLVYPWGSELHIALGNIITDYQREGRNHVPDVWRIAGMTGEVSAGGKEDYCYAHIYTPLTEAVDNVTKFLNAAYKLPVSEKLGVWNHFARFCGKVEELGEWLGLHHLLSYHPEKCLVVIDWSEVAMFYDDPKEIKRAANNKRFLKYLSDLEHASTTNSALEAATDSEDRSYKEVNFFEINRILNPFTKFRQEAKDSNIGNHEKQT